MKKYILNETPVRTTNNYRINNLEIELDIPKPTNINEYMINQDIEINKKEKENYTSKIGLEHKNYNEYTINIEKNYKEPIIFNYEFTKDNNVLIETININVQEKKNANLIFRFTSKEESFHNVKFIINSNNNSKLNISILNLLDKDSKSFIAIENYQRKSSNTRINFIDLGGSLKVSNYYNELLEENAVTKFNNIYIGTKEDRIDMNYYSKNIASKTEGYISVEGCIDDNSYKSFKGTIDFIKGCTSSKGLENENCILLSDTCRTRSLPMLLCQEENVEGAHGVSSGKIDKDKLFYLMTRGLSESESKRLIINANFSDIIKNIPDEGIREEIINIVNKKI